MSLGQGWVRNDGAPDEFGKLRPILPGVSQEVVWNVKVLRQTF